MASSKCFFTKPLPWIAILVPFFVCASFSGYGLLSILFTTLVLILSSVFFTFSKPKPVIVDKALEDDQECLSELGPERETITQKEESQEVGVLGQVHDYLVRSPDSFSESESIDHSSTSEDDLPDSGDVSQSPDCSDDSISDEESLIEIALPTGHYADPEEEEEEEEPKSNLQKKFADFSPESLFRQGSLMEVLAEANEEENLIEIDLSMGSIK
uniref:Putative myelin transcription factor 1-like protein n=1 Tax=Davidia involucrata TaxID=16924 RepID=A0A5B6YM64_DAVIN